MAIYPLNSVEEPGPRYIDPITLLLDIPGTSVHLFSAMRPGPFTSLLRITHEISNMNVFLNRKSFCTRQIKHPMANPRKELSCPVDLHCIIACTLNFHLILKLLNLTKSSEIQFLVVIITPSGIRSAISGSNIPHRHSIQI